MWMRAALVLSITVASGGACAPGGPHASAFDPLCSTPVPQDPRAADRAACAFRAGSRAADTVALPSGSLPIQHVIVVMKENRSFDHIFGALSAVQSDAMTFPPGFNNPDPHGAPVAPFHLHTTCEPYDLGHQWEAMHRQIDGGKMDGYAKVAAAYTGTDGWFALGYYNQTDLPFYYWLASTFAINDQYFPSVRSGTYPNRDYLLLGTSDRVYST